MALGPEHKDGKGKPCKDYDAIYWNKFNQVVQCHRCGHVFIPATKADYHQAAVENMAG